MVGFRAFIGLQGKFAVVLKQIAGVLFRLDRVF